MTALQDAAIQQAACPSLEKSAMTGSTNLAPEAPKTPGAGRPRVELGSLAGDLSIG